MNDLTGKTYVITGGTAGIGAASAQALAARGATVVLVGRNREKCAAVAQAIQQSTGNAAVEWLVADLARQAEVRALARAVQAKYARLAGLINNAGAMYLTHQVSPDGIELTWALNHLAYFLLTTELLPLLKASAPMRVVNVASEVQANAQIAWDDPQKLRGFEAYGQSKLANIMFTYELAERVRGTGITVNAVHPGMVASDFAMPKGWLGGIARWVYKWFALTPEQGAWTVVRVATAPELAEVSGQYFHKEQQLRSAPISYDRAACQRLWTLSERMVGGSA